LSQIDQLLSEGEQKAVALADFFTELSVQNQKTPVIFDDPATSFDHERKEKIAKRIVEESEKRQVIVFTHDLMFASYMYERVENPVKGVIDPTKAAFHDLRSEKNQSGLVTENYYHGSVKFDPYIQRIDHKIASMGKLDRADQDEAIGTTYSMLRRAIEKAVEERIFGGVMIRWTDQIQMHNAPRASLSREKLNQAKALHEEFSRFIEAHNQSNEMIQHSVPDVVKLRKDLQKVKDIALR
jgi:wobble nucleotide-excising tRNase